jgi:hypothetical protein
MKKTILLLSSLIICSSISVELVNAHGGRTNSQGCHNQSGGSYHCHNGGSSSGSSGSSSPSRSSGSSGSSRSGSSSTSTSYSTPLTVNNLRSCTISIKTGDKGEAVGQVQKDLAKLGYLPTNAPDGVFGNQTEVAVVKYQEDNELTKDGIVGCNTFSAITEDVNDLN